MSDEFKMEDFFDQLEEDEPKEQFDKQCAEKSVHLGKIEIELVMDAYHVSRPKAVAILKRKNAERQKQVKTVRRVD